MKACEIDQARFAFDKRSVSSASVPVRFGSVIVCDAVSEDASVVVTPVELLG